MARNSDRHLNGTAGGRLNRRQLLAQAGAVSAAGMAAAHLPGLGPATVTAARQDAATPVAGGSLTWAVDILNDTLPYGAIGQPPTHVFTYDSLIMWDSTLQAGPGLAESWEAVDDVTYVYKLRQGVLFHDGKEMTAEDVKYSLELHREPPPPGQSFAFYPKIESIDIVDPYTVQFNLREPDPSLVGYTTWTRYSNIMPVGMNEAINVLSEADGTGPFRLTEFETSSHATLTRNESYWSPGIPNLDEIRIVFLPEEQSRVAALRAGEIDGGSFSADVASTMRDDNDLTVLSGLQANHREIQITTKGDPKPWHDIRVRQAITHAIDRQDLIDKVYAGEAEISGVIPTGYGDWPIPVDELRNNYLKYDVDMARQLMADAGFADGFSVTLQSIATPRDFTSCAEVVREHLADINIDVSVEPLEFGTFAKNNGEGNYDWQLTGRGFRGDPSGFLNEFNPKSAIFPNWFGENWNNEELTALLDEGLLTADQARRHELYTQAQQILLTEAVHVTLVQPMVYHVVRNRVKGMAVSYSGDIAYGLKVAWVED
jgi:peptide/nickel transport system substrate-binding protein